MQSELAAKIFGDKEDPRQRLQSIFGGALAVSGPPSGALEWAKDVLADAGVDPADHHASAIKQLRAAQSRLTLKAAAYLVDDLARK